MIVEANSDVAVTERRLLDSVDAANSEKDPRGETGASKSGIPHNTAEDEKAMQYVEESKKPFIGGSGDR
jgi:hypothetical protein